MARDLAQTARYVEEEMEMSTTERRSKEEVFAQIDAGWQNWLEAIADLDNAAMIEAGACGDWSVKDLAFHIAFWDEQGEFDAAYRAEHNGEAPPERDWQAMNEQDHANQQNRPPSDAIAVMSMTHVSLMHTLVKYGNQDLTWAIGDFKDHYDEHAAQVRTWRQSRSNPV
jgi:Mycothiol maleylpyruvate isomerase N-terminal domain